jgi:hypothetical protein
MAKLTRIPLDVVVVSTGERTSGKLVGVMVDDLDELLARFGKIAQAVDSLTDDQLSPSGRLLLEGVLRGKG